MAKFHAGIKVGSSPRMRGTPWPHTAPAAALGLIPTYAGNTRIIFWRVTRKRAHPHVCGEHAHGFPVDGFEVGSSPRMRGTPKSSLKPVSLKGLIPTYAGNTGKKIFLPRPLRAHPHVCGEHHMARGPRSKAQWLIPTYAGNTMAGAPRRGRERAHPHVCGEHRYRCAGARYRGGSSPRMRGTRKNESGGSAVPGLIPTYAGNTQSSQTKQCRPRAHPHVCGEH